MAEDPDALCAELLALSTDQAAAVVTKWLETRGMSRTLASFADEVASLAALEPHESKGGLGGNGSSSASISSPAVAPAAEALPVPGTSSRPGKLYDTEALTVQQVPEMLLTKPDPIFHGERDERKRESSQLHDFAMQVHYDRFTSGLESETHFRVEEKQVIAGRYVVIQYLGSGTFCHTVQCEDLRGMGRHRFVCVKISKNTKDIFDQNLWEVKLLKLLSSQMSAEEAVRLPLLLNVFYFRETLFIVYELLRDNLYHIYKYIEECKLPRYFTVERLRHVAKQCLLTLECLHKRDVIHCDLKPENILISSLTACKIKVIDYGNAYLHQDQRCSYVQSRAYRAPEVVLGLAYDTKVDLWSLGCILMELFTGKLLFDNRSVQALLASHIAVLGPFSKGLLRDGALSDHYFTDHSESSQWKNGLVGKQEGRLWRFRPRKTSIGQILAANGCDDAELVSFIEALVRTDPDARLDATEALRHPFITSCPVECSPYALGEDDTKGEAGLRLLMKYASLNDARVQDGRAKNPVADALLQEEANPGPATPTAFREQCYLNRERMEKKRARKSGSSRLAGADMPNLDHMVITNPSSS